jgi:hypothetical protein
MGLSNPLKAVSLDQLNKDQLDNATKTGLHVKRQGFELISNAIIEQFHDPCHLPRVLHFCNTRKRNISPYSGRAR